MFNRTLFEQGVDIVAAFVSSDMNTDIDGDWVNLKHKDRVYVLIAKPAGTAGDDLSIKLQQATDNAGTGAKALNFRKLWHKVGTLTAVPVWTAVILDAPTDDLDLVSVNGVDLATDSNQAMVMVEVMAESLDADNRFTHVRVQIEGDDIANATVISGFYIFTGDHYPQDIPLSAIG